MLKLTFKLIPFRAIKLLFKFLASLASAIVVVSGYLFFVSSIDRTGEEEVSLDNAEDSDAESDPKTD